MANLLDTNLRMQMYQKLKAESEASKHFFKSFNWTRSYEPFFELLWALKLPCFDTSRFSDYPNHRSLLRLCIWKGRKLPCSSIFSTFPTESGMCCTFNLQKADEMLKESKFVDSVKSLQARDEKESYETTQTPGWFQRNKEPVPKQGVHNGLTIMLDAHTDLVQDASVSDDSTGFFVAITPQETYPLVNLNSIMLRPGHENYVAITATDVIASDTFKGVLSQEQRRCYYPDEKELDAYSQYSHPGCVLECHMKQARKGVAERYGGEECYPWFLPHAEKNVSVCDPWQTRIFVQQMNKASEDCPDCLVDCEYTEFTATVTAIPFRKCSNKNLGISELCNIENIFGPNPGLYGAQIHEQFGNPDQLPGYAHRHVTSTRQYTKNPKEEFFSKSFTGSEKLNYDAYEEDIAMVSFY